MNAINVENPSARAVTLLLIGESTLVRNPTNVMSVGKPSVRNQLSLCEDIEANSLRVEQGLEAPIKKPELEAPDKPITKKNRY